MSNQEIIERLLRDGTVYPIYDNGTVVWFCSFPAGSEMIGTERFEWDDICNLWREQNEKNES